MSEYDYNSKSDIEIARLINLAIMLHNGISEEDAGFDMVTTLNATGLAQVARIVGEARTERRTIGPCRRSAWLSGNPKQGALK